MKHYVPVNNLPISPQELRKQGRNPNTYYLRRYLGSVPREIVARELAEQGYDLTTYKNGYFLPDKADLPPNVDLIKDEISPNLDMLRDGIRLAKARLSGTPASGPLLPHEHADIVANRQAGVPGNQK